jgi:penicillin-binding protein 1A
LSKKPSPPNNDLDLNLDLGFDPQQLDLSGLTSPDDKPKRSQKASSPKVITPPRPDQTVPAPIKQPPPPQREDSLSDWLGGPASEAPPELSRTINKNKPTRAKKRHYAEPKQVLPKTGRGFFNRLAWGLLWTALSLIITCSAIVFFCYAYYSQDLPSVQGLKTYRPKTVTYFYSHDGQVIGEYSHERRIVLPLDKIPPLVRQAFIAVEDTNFYNHGGVNFLAIVRAAYNNLRNESLQGASTITQQVVRSFLLTNERKISRKIREIILAMRLEAALSKDEIITIYLNQIYLGQGAYGVEAAAQTYFDKHVEQLTIGEAAMLAGITQSPEGKNPIRRPDEARARQIHGINRMITAGFITPEQANTAKNEILNIVGERINPNTTMAPYFAEHVRRLLADKLGEDSLYNDGWKVYTTLNLSAQKAADSAVAKGLWEYARRRGFKGPINRLESQVDIERTISDMEKKLPPNGLLPSYLYQAVITEVKAKENTLVVQVGSYGGIITKKNLDWILPKGSLSKQLQEGDLIWVRLDDKEDPGVFPENREATLARIGAGQESDTTLMSFVLEQ